MIAVLSKPNFSCGFGAVRCIHESKNPNICSTADIKGRSPCGHKSIFFIRPDQKLDYITERLKS